MRPVATELAWERRGFRLGGVLLAAVVAIALSFVPIPVPAPGSLDAALTEIAIVGLIRSWGVFAAIVVILSIGRQGIDVLVLRAMMVAFILGVVVIALFLSPALFFAIPINPRIPLPLAVVAFGLGWAVILGPIFAIFAALANLLWYRSFRSLRPQLRIFNRGKRLEARPQQ